MSQRKYLQALARYETSDEYAIRLSKILDATTERHEDGALQQRQRKSRARAQWSAKRSRINRERYARETLDEREKRCAELRKVCRQRRARETLQQRATRLARDAKRRANETSQQRKKRLSREREHKAERRTKETLEHREEHLSTKRRASKTKRKLEISKYKARRHQRIYSERHLFGAAVPEHHRFRSKLYRTYGFSASSGSYIVASRPDFTRVNPNSQVSVDFSSSVYTDVHSPIEIVMRRRLRVWNMRNQTRC